MAKRGHIPIRMCVGCGLRRPKDELLRFTWNCGKLVPSKQGGRGVYVCDDEECAKKARKKGFLLA